jgi:hypothetical protein
MYEGCTITRVHEENRSIVVCIAPSGHHSCNNTAQLKSLDFGIGRR